MTVNISVSVTDEEDHPVSGVSVSLDTVSGTTGSAGGCTLSNVPLGSATLTAIKEGYVTYNENVTISADTTSLVIVLTSESTGNYPFMIADDMQSTICTGECTLEVAEANSGYTKVTLVDSTSGQFPVGAEFLVDGDILIVPDGTTWHHLLDDIDLYSGFTIRIG